MINSTHTFPRYVKSCCKALLWVSIVFSCYSLRAQAPNISYQTPNVYFVNTAISPLVPKNTGGAVPATIYAQVTAFVGSGAAGYADGTGTSAVFGHPARLAQDPVTGNLYVADRDNGVIRKVTPAGVVTTFAGGFNQPNDVVLDGSGNMYVADAASNSIKFVTASGTVSTFAGGNQGYFNGTGTNAGFYYPYGINMDAAGNLYVADSQNNAIRKIDPSGNVTTFAGTTAAGSNDGPGLQATFDDPNSIAMDASGNLYIGDSKNNKVRKISPVGVVSTYAGTGVQGSQNGTLATATFTKPGGVAFDAAGNTYIADVYNYLIRKVDKLGNVSTLAGSGTLGSSDGVGTAASFSQAYGLNYNSAGFLYVTDLGANNIRKICLTGYTIDKALPPGLTFDPTTGIISGTPTTAWPSTDYTVTAYNLAGSSSIIVNITVAAAKPAPVKAPNISYHTPNVYLVNNTITTIVPNNSGGNVPPGTYGQVTSFAGSGQTGSADGAMQAASFNHPIRSGFDAATGNFYVADRDNNLIRSVTRQAVVNTYASGFFQPNGVVVSPDGDLFVADAASNTIKQVKQGGVVSTFAGNGSQSFQDGMGTAAGFYYPYDLVMDTFGNLYVVDSQNNAIRKITPSGVVSTLAGNGAPGYADGLGAQASFNSPNNIAIDQSNNLYVGDTHNNRIRMITPAGMVTTIAGSGATGYQDGPDASATFNSPGGIAVDDGGDLFVSDVSNYVIRRIDAKGFVTTLAGAGTAGDMDGLGKAAKIGRTYGAMLDPDGSLFVTDLDNNKIKIIQVTGFTIDKTLPAGLSFDPLTGKISGTPTIVSPATDYTVTAYNLGGSSSAVVNIRVISAISLATIPHKTVCSTDFAPNVTGGAGYYTVTSSNLAVATIVNGNIHIVAPGTTTITATDGVTSQSQALTVDQPVTPTISINPSTYSGCDGMSYTYTATVTNAGTSPTYQWYVNGQAAGSNSNSFTSSSLKNGDIINCILTNTTDCVTGPATSNNATLTSIPYITPAVSIQSSATGTVPQGTEITFTATATNGGSNPIYQWQVNNVNVGTNSPTYSNNCFNDGDVVTCTLTNQGGACLTANSATSNIITVSTSASAGTITVSASATTIYMGQFVTFTVTAVGIGNSPVFQWKVNNADVGTNNSIYSTNSLKNGDVVTCVLTDNGCTTPITGNSITMTVLVPPGITIPTAFTPNNDGINDQWQIEALSGYPNCMVDIFTRYGTMIFHSKGYSQPWDGTFKGNKLAPGTYYYLIDLGNNSPKLSGYVTLIR